MVKQPELRAGSRNLTTGQLGELTSSQTRQSKSSVAVSKGKTSQLKGNAHKHQNKISKMNIEGLQYNTTRSKSQKKVLFDKTTDGEK